MEHIPIGFSRQEGQNESSLSPLKEGKECVNCGETVVAYSIQKNADWGRPEHPATAYCNNCHQKYELALVPVE